MSDQHLTARLWTHLRRAYLATHDEDGQLTPVDEGQQVLIQWLRIHTVPAEFLVDEFDRHLQETGSRLTVAPRTVYRRECRRFRSLSAERRRNLAQTMSVMLYGDGQVPHADGFGDEIEAFCFDTKTGRWIIRRGKGTHSLSAKMLYEQIRPEELRRKWPLPNEDRRVDFIARSAHFVLGFLIPVPGWTTPVLKLLEREPAMSPGRYCRTAHRLQTMGSWLVTTKTARHFFRRS